MSVGGGGVPLSPFLLLEKWNIDKKKTNKNHGELFCFGGLEVEAFEEFSCFFFGGNAENTHKNNAGTHKRKKRSIKQGFGRLSNCEKILKLGGFNIFLEFSPLFGEDFQFD